MSQQRRAPQIPDIPPFHNKAGGPLQPRHAPNQSHYSDLRSGVKQPQTVKPVMEPPTTKHAGHTSETRRQQQQRSGSKPSSSSHRDRSRTQAEPEPRPSSRLANEKKKDYKDPPNIGPWKLGKLIGQGASGE